MSISYCSGTLQWTVEEPQWTTTPSLWLDPTCRNWPVMGPQPPSLLRTMKCTLWISGPGTVLVVAVTVLQAISLKARIRFFLPVVCLWLCSHNRSDNKSGCYQNLHSSIPAGCGGPSTPGNGSLVQFVSAEVSAVITYQCSPGFIPRAPQMSVCAQNRSWAPDPAQLLCQEPPPGDCCLVAVHNCAMYVAS